MTAAPRAATSLLTIPQTAKRLAVCDKTVYRLISEGELRAVELRVTGTKPKTRVREDDLAAFIDKRTRETA